MGLQHQIPGLACVVDGFSWDETTEELDGTEVVVLQVTNVQRLR